MFKYYLHITRLFIVHKTVNSQTEHTVKKSRYIISINTEC